MHSGQPGVCKMYIWDSTKPRRDGIMENDIVVHEMTHGITNRMTGGGTGRCLQTTEAGVLGECWSDAMAEYVSLHCFCFFIFIFGRSMTLRCRWVTQNSEKVEDFVMGQYVLGTAQAIGTNPYSTNAYVFSHSLIHPWPLLSSAIRSTTNPLRYFYLTTLDEVHAIGDVWVNMLHTWRRCVVASLRPLAPMIHLASSGSQGWGRVLCRFGCVRCPHGCSWIFNDCIYGPDGQGRQHRVHAFNDQCTAITAMYPYVCVVVHALLTLLRSTFSFEC